MTRTIELINAITDTTQEFTDIVAVINCYIRVSIDDMTYVYRASYELDSPNRTRFIEFDNLDRLTVIGWIESKYSNELAEIESTAMAHHAPSPPIVRSTKTFNF